MDFLNIAKSKTPSKKGSIRLTEQQKNEVLGSLDPEVLNNALKNKEIQLPKKHKISVTLSPDGSHAQVLMPGSASPVIQSLQEQPPIRAPRSPSPRPRSPYPSSPRSTHPDSNIRRNTSSQSLSSLANQHEQPTKSFETQESDPAVSVLSDTSDRSSNTFTNSMGLSKVDVPARIEAAMAYIQNSHNIQPGTRPRISLKQEPISKGLFKKQVSESILLSYPSVKEKDEKKDKKLSLGEMEYDIDEVDDVFGSSSTSENEIKIPKMRVDDFGVTDEATTATSFGPSKRFGDFSTQGKESGIYSLEPPNEKWETASMRSYRSTRTVQSTAEELEEIKLEKKQRLWDFFTMVTSILYAMFILILGMVCYFGDLFVVDADSIHFSEIFNLYLCIVGIGVISWLLYDIQNYISSFSKYKEAGSFTLEQLQLVEGPDGELNLEIPLPDSREKLPEYYCFSTGRHAGSFFLKIGAGVFCFGHLIHIILNLAKQGVYFTADNSTVVEQCASQHVVAFGVIYPIFSFLELFLVFKFSNVIVNRSKHFARFAFMHCLSSSLCFWMYTIVNETLDTLVLKFFNKKLNESCDDDDEEEDDTIVNQIRNLVTAILDLFLNSSYGEDLELVSASAPEIPECHLSNGTRFEITNNAICVLVKRHMCSSNSGPISKSLFNMSPLLYPFSIEFSILIVAIWYVMWSNIGKVEENINSIELLPSMSPNESTEDLHRTAGHKEAMIIYADCASSNKGLFMGLLVLVGTVVMIIIHFFMGTSCRSEDIEASILIAHATEWFLYASLIFAIVTAYVKVARLEVNPHPISFLDDLLLFICIPSFVLYSLVSLVPDIFEETRDYLYAVTNTLTIAQVLIQTPFIVDGLRRCSDSEESTKKLPGRNTVMFLIVVNLASYILESFLLQSPTHSQERKAFYGVHIWTILTHITMPLCIFYRFHSAVALVDIWTSAYRPSHN